MCSNSQMMYHLSSVQLLVQIRELHTKGLLKSEFFVWVLIVYLVCCCRPHTHALQCTCSQSIDSLYCPVIKLHSMHYLALSQRFSEYVMNMKCSLDYMSSAYEVHSITVCDTHGTCLTYNIYTSLYVTSMYNSSHMVCI